MSSVNRERRFCPSCQAHCRWCRKHRGIPGAHKRESPRQRGGLMGAFRRTRCEQVSRQIIVPRRMRGIAQLGFFIL